MMLTNSVNAETMHDEYSITNTVSNPLPPLSSFLGAGERRAFDREVDILGRRAIGEHQVQELVQRSKELDSRFDKGSVQRSFL